MYLYVFEKGWLPSVYNKEVTHTDGGVEGVLSQYRFADADEEPCSPRAYQKLTF